MSDEPASYRSGSAAFELHVGSAFKAILPGAFQGAVIGSLLVAAWVTLQSATSGAGFALSDILSTVMLFCFVLMAGTMGGMIACAIYLSLIGFPLALLMRKRIATRAMLVVTLLVATITGLLTSRVLMAPIWGLQEHEWLLTTFALGYAIPTGIAYRQAIITERLLSFWSRAVD